MLTFKQFIAEGKDAEKLFGQHLFGELRKLNELDTPFEAEQFIQVKGFIDEFYGKKLTSEVIETFKTLLKYKKDFPKVLDPGNYKVLYRGMRASRDRNKKLLTDLFTYLYETDPAKIKTRKMGNKTKLSYLQMLIIIFIKTKIIDIMSNR